MNPDPDQRPDPDALLAGLKEEERQSAAGKLHIFLGMCPGVGKTYAMLQAARQRLKEGVQVLAGVVETHRRSETADLLKGLPQLPKKTIEHREQMLSEFDLDGVLTRRPQLILVDELAHTNVPGSRHPKRYQDVLELLDAGIDVYTTLNVQHIESQVDTVRQITGVIIRETVPDSILDRADEIQIIDLPVDKLRERLAEGKVYLGERAQTAADHFFQEGNLTALRELALRFTAERVDRDLEDIRRARRVSSAWKTNARLLVGVGSSPFAESLIRWTRRAATRLDCPWIVAWVEPSGTLTAVQQEMLAGALGLARRLGAEVVSLTGDDVAGRLLALARERNVTQLVVGKPEKRMWFRPALTDRIIKGSGDIDVCLVRPLLGVVKSTTLPAAAGPGPADLWEEYGWMIALVAGLSFVGAGLVEYTGYMAVGLFFLLTVVLAALRLSRGPVLVLAAFSALSWDYFFIPPRFTFYISKLEDVVMFGSFFVVAVSMGHLTTRLRTRERAERDRQRRTAALLRVTQAAALSAEPAKGLAEALRTIEDSLRVETALVPRESDHSLSSTAHPASGFKPGAKELGVVAWAYANRQTAGRFTDTLPDSEATWFPLQTATSLMGVMGVRLPEEQAMDFTMRQTVEAFVLQIALVLEKEHFIKAAQRAEVLDQSERLRRTLLDSVSHELKTPLAVIQAALDGLDRQPDAPQPYLAEIRTANRRLQRVVDNLLHMTRLESSVLTPQREWCDLADVIAEARESCGDALKDHPLRLDLPPGLPLLKLDQPLLVQALANLLHNTALHTPAGTEVEISTQLDPATSRLTLRVRDHGPGLPDGPVEQVFGKFYRGPGAPTGGTGLGLPIARGLIRAQDGDVTARTHPEGGAEFAITLPVEIVAE